MRLTKNLAIAMAKAFATYTIECDRQEGRSQPIANIDCVAAEESDCYQSFIAEIFYQAYPVPRGQELNWDAIDTDAMYQLFRKTLYEHARILQTIREEMDRLDYSDEDVAAMFPTLEGQELLDMLAGAEPTTDAEGNEI